MRMRAYRPEVSGCLEGRLLLSGVAGRPAAPYPFPGHQYKLFVNHVGIAFTLYARYHDKIQLHNEFDDIIPLIPFARADGLSAKIDGIVDKMMRDIRANVPHAIRTAHNDVIAVASNDKRFIDAAFGAAKLLFTTTTLFAV